MLIQPEFRRAASRDIRGINFLPCLRAIRLAKVEPPVLTPTGCIGSGEIISFI